MSKRKNTIDDFLVWAGIILVALSAILDFFLLFTANYLRNMLFTLPIWVLGFACFVIIGNREKNKKTRSKKNKRQCVGDRACRLELDLEGISV